MGIVGNEPHMKHYDVFLEYFQTPTLINEFFRNPFSVHCHEVDHFSDEFS